jgi:methylated-DNA-protein-cysteine methyltransferase related protein
MRTPSRVFYSVEHFARQDPTEVPDNSERIDRILERVRAIPKGYVRTFGDIDPKAPRLVGRVLATHPARVPWHRVARSDGSVPMGARQLELLRREKVPLRGDRVDMSEAHQP